MCEAVSISDV